MHHVVSLILPGNLLLQNNYNNFFENREQKLNSASKVPTLAFPWQLQIGSAHIPLHSIFETAGIFIGFRYFLYLRKKQADIIETSNRVWIIIGALFGSVIGSRLIGGLENPDVLFHTRNIFLHFYYNKTILGGLLGGVAGVEFTKLLVNEKSPSGDLFTFPIILAMIIGRIGCFSMGVHEETYGIPTTSLFGMNLGDNQLRHPVTLYEISFLIAVWWMLKKINATYLLAPGGLFKIFMVAYLIFRFALDFIKPHYNFEIGLSTIQITAVCGLLYYSPYILHPKKILMTYA